MNCSTGPANNLMSDYDSSPESMDCRIGCAACCIVISITSPIPGMPDGKPAGVRCIQLTDDNRCQLFNKPERPDVCISFKPDIDICGSTNEEAFSNIKALEADGHY